MTNNQLALDFAKEVMGWEDAVIEVDGDSTQITSKHWDTKDNLPLYVNSYYGDGVILTLIEDWAAWGCFDLKIELGGYKVKCTVTGMIPDGEDDYIDDVEYACIEGENFTEVLMEAALIAERKDNTLMEAERKRIGAKGGE